MISASNNLHDRNMKRINIHSEAVTTTRKLISNATNIPRMPNKSLRFWLGLLGVLTVVALLYFSPSQVLRSKLHQLTHTSPNKPDNGILIPHDITVVNPHDYRFTINPLSACERDTTLVVFVTSNPDHKDRRQGIRETWANPESLGEFRSKVYFLLGKPKEISLQSQLLQEDRLYNDIIQEDFVDSYLNLTLKTIMALKWTATECPQAQFVMKTDDDIFVNLPRLVAFLKRNRQSRWITGCIKQRKSPPAISFNGLPAPPGHPPFVAGAGYIISGDLVLPLYQASLQRKIIPVEDVYITAHCARMLNVTPEHNGDFSCGEKVSNECKLSKSFTGHHVTPEQQHYYWQLHHHPNSPCHIVS